METIDQPDHSPVPASAADNDEHPANTMVCGAPRRPGASNHDAGRSAERTPSVSDRDADTDADASS